MLNSEEGRGSTFFFEIELPLSHLPPDASESDVYVDLTDVRVLVVDDNETNRRILEEMLKGWKMQPTMANGGSAALEEMRRAASNGLPFELVLTDCHMPQMDGFMFVEELRKSPELAGATIMMLTSGGHLGDAARCRELGLAAYLFKPVSQGDLVEAIRQALAERAVGSGPPLRLVARPANTPAGTPKPGEGRSPLRVLLAEDNAINQLVALRIMEKQGHEVVVVENGLNAIEAFESTRFDVVLMDVQMPVIGGFEATTKIRDLERTRGGHLPIIGLTAHAMKGNRERCLEAGMDGYLAKPVKAQELCALIEQLVGLSPRSSLSSIVNDQDPAAIFDAEMALENACGDAGLLGEIARLWLAASGNLSQIRDAVSALEYEIGRMQPEFERLAQHREAA